MHHQSQTDVKYKIEVQESELWECVFQSNDRLKAESHLASIVGNLQRYSQARILRETTTIMNTIDLLKLIEV